MIEETRTQPGAREEGAPRLSFVVPCHNEAGNVRELARSIAEHALDNNVACEIVFVNDGSTDGTLDELRALARETPQADPLAPTIRVISFSRNFGKEGALYAGMEASRGSAVCLIDADLQQDPAVAFDMYAYLCQHDECDVVAAYQERRREGRAVAWLKERFYAFFNATSDEIELPANMSDFRVFRRTVAEALLSMPERLRFSKGLFAWVGFTTHAVPYQAAERKSGTSSWRLKSLFRYAFTGITAFSTWPLKVLKYIGGLVALASALYLLYVLVVDYLVLGVDVPGYTTLVSLVLIFGGLQLAAIGIVGDYLARAYIEGKSRPLYIVKETFGSDSPEGSTQ